MRSTNSVSIKDMDTKTTKEVLNYPPKKLLLSVTQNCNLKCLHCPRQVEPNLSGEMGKNLLSKIIREMFPSLEYVRIGGNNLGEQMTYTHFNYLIREAMRNKSHGKPFIELYTNGSLISRNNARAIVECCDRIKLSVESAGRDYEAIRSVDWTKFMNSVRLLARAKKDAGSNIEICLCVALISDYMPNLGKLFEIKGVDKIVFGHFCPVFPSDYPHAPFFNMQSTNHWLDYYRKLARKKRIKLVAPENFNLSKDSFCKKNQYEICSEKRGNCHFPWETMHIDYDGSVYGCCYKLKMGKIGLKSSVMEIWNGRAYRSLRRKVNSSRHPLICKYCEEVASPTMRFASYFDPMRHYHLYYQKKMLEKKLDNAGLKHLKGLRSFLESAFR